MHSSPSIMHLSLSTSEYDCPMQCIKCNPFNPHCLFSLTLMHIQCKLQQRAPVMYHTSSMSPSVITKCVDPFSNSPYSHTYALLPPSNTCCILLNKALLKC
ncbi:hypothetical protein KP509_20G016600 [Ceratopteris richardii]|uniref:Uncharacterized protein n=1 Tax=Ceratopteris richardii TaxID=49495 RepID=A0A8T2SDG0_CERRI|nr:hypothetical protein KP509_20G016600 [Ceratopteris richardii]